MTSFCDNCFKAVSHEGTAQGKTEQIGGVQCYIAVPTVDYPTDKVVLFLTDVFGLALSNNLLLADDFARNGFKTIVPDLFTGDPFPPNAMEPGSQFDMKKWAMAHTPTATRSLIDHVIDALKEQGITRIAATGYCFGGRFTVYLGTENRIQVSAISHPGRMKLPDDLEKYAALSTAPLLINSCTEDPTFPHEAQAQADNIVGDGKFGPGYKREYFEGCEHGFAVRGDLSDPRVKAGKEGAFKACVDWFVKYL